MGKRGPSKIPPEVKMRRGTHRSDRDGVPLAVTKGVPPCPDWISEDARLHWQKIASMLNDQGLLTQLDQTAIALLCEALAEFIHHKSEAVKNGWTAMSEKGGVYQDPSVGMMNKARETVIRLLREFGMTVSSRANLAVSNKKNPTNEKERFIKGLVG
jgi:P27 family predicted phage terminase small subunit